MSRLRLHPFASASYFRYCYTKIQSVLSLRYGRYNVPVSGREVPEGRVGWRAVHLGDKSQRGVTGVLKY